MADIQTMPPVEKIGEAMRRSLPMLPAEAREQVAAMLTPTSLAIVAGTLIVWAGSHFFGVGEIVDVILLIVGAAFVGLGVFSGARELYDFTTTALNARTDADLDRAAAHFAKAVNILGISIISGILLKKSAKPVINRGAPQVQPIVDVGPPPPPGARPTVTREHLPPGSPLGTTDSWGNIVINRSQPLSEQRMTLYHEWVHRTLSPRIAPLRQLRAQIGMSGYMRSAILRYLEEAMAESYAQLRMHGMEHIIVGIRFPIEGGYVTISQLAAEGTAIGNITIGGMQFGVYMRMGTGQP